MNKDLGQVLYECMHKYNGWPDYWEILGDTVKQRYRDAAFKFAAYIGKEAEDE